MKKDFLFTSMLAVACILSSCDKGSTSPDEPSLYDGTVLSTVLFSKCSGDLYGLGTNIIDLRLSTGDIVYDSGTESFSGAGTCIVLSLMDVLTDDCLPSEGVFTPTDWENMEVNKTFDPGFCEYNTEFACWLAAGTYMVSIDKEGNIDYVGFTGGNVTIGLNGEVYTIDCVLKEENGEETKARYEGRIDFTTPASEKYQYENSSPETVTATINSVDVRYWGTDENGLGLYKLSIWGENEKITMIELRIGSPDNTRIPDGRYSITDDVRSEGILAGYYSQGALIGAYTSQWDNLYEQVLNVWYLVDGFLTVGNNADGTITLTLDASSAYGSTVRFSYTGDFSFLDIS